MFMSAVEYVNNCGCHGVSYDLLYSMYQSHGLYLEEKYLMFNVNYSISGINKTLFIIFGRFWCLALSV